MIIIIIVITVVMYIFYIFCQYLTLSLDTQIKDEDIKSFLYNNNIEYVYKTRFPDRNGSIFFEDGCAYRILHFSSLDKFFLPTWIISSKKISGIVNKNSRYNRILYELYKNQLKNQ